MCTCVGTPALHRSYQQLHLLPRATPYTQNPPAKTEKVTDRNEGAVRDWLSAWRAARLSSVVTGHAGNESAAKLTRARKNSSKRP